MRISKIRRYRKKHKLFTTMLTDNPVLVLGLDLPFVIATGVSLKNAAAMSIQMFFIHIATMLAAIVTVRLLPLWQRAIANVAVSTVMMVISREIVIAIFPDISNSAGIYIALMALNGMTLLQANFISKKSRVAPVASSAFMNSLAFAAIIFIVSLVREYFGNGTLWGVAVPAPIKLTGILIPFFGFIFMGFLLAFARFINRALRAYQVSEAMRSEKPIIEIM